MTTSQQPTSFVALVSRLFWMMLGPMILIVLALNIATIGTSWFTMMDIAFLVVLAFVLAARGIEFLGASPQTATGEPATMDDYRRYALVVLAIGLAIWVVANVVGNHLLGG